MFKFSSLTALAIFSGSFLSILFGVPVAILQNVHFLVQTLPKIIKVACFLFQHSPILGQAASSHTVFKLNFLLYL